MYFGNYGLRKTCLNVKNCLKLSPLRREYVSWAVNALANSVESFDINMRDFFQANCLHSDQ